MSDALPKVNLGRTRLAWAIRWRSVNHFDGLREYLVGDPDHPSRTRLFHTREAARAYRDNEYGYFRNRPDLREEPHGWQMPQVVKVRIVVEML